MDIISQVKKAVELSKNNDFKTAEEIYLNILKTDKTNATVLSLLGLLYINTGNFKRAYTTLKKADSIKPNNISTLEALGFACFNMYDFRTACKYFEKILDVTKNFEVYDKYISSLIEQRRYTLAYDTAIKAGKLFPLNKNIMSALVYTCIYTGRLNDAIKYSQQLMSAYPKYSKSWLRQGLIQEVIFHNEEAAEKCYKIASKYDDKNDAYYNLAICYCKMQEYKKAQYYLKKVIKAEGLSSSYCFMQATIYFFQRQFRKAFRYYCAKDLFINESSTLYKLKNFWDGKRYKDKSLLVFCDQGIGDCIMFSRYFPFLEKYFKEIKISAPEAMLKLLKRSFKQNKKIKFYKRNKRILKTDKSIIMSDLPYMLKMEADFPLSEGYLEPNKLEVKKYKEKYFNTEKLKVGICWEAGGSGIREQLNRTLHLSVYDELLKMDDVQFYSLQYKPSLEDYKNYPNLIDLGNSFKDFDNTASAIKNLDVVITVDTSVAHLAGALGVKTFMLLPYCPDWRWFDNNKTTEWYDSIKIFKQTDHVFWDKEIADIKSELKELL